MTKQLRGTPPCNQPCVQAAGLIRSCLKRNAVDRSGAQILPWHDRLIKDGENPPFMEGFLLNMNSRVCLREGSQVMNQNAAIPTFPPFPMLKF